MLHRLFFFPFTACNLAKSASKKVIVPTLSVKTTTDTSRSVSRGIISPDYKYLLDLTAIPEDEKGKGPLDFATLLVGFAPMTTGFTSSSMDEIDNTVTVNTPGGSKNFKIESLKDGGYKYEYKWDSNVKDSKDKIKESYISITTDQSTEPRTIRESTLFGWKGRDNTISYINKYSTFTLQSGSYLEEAFVVDYTSRLYYYVEDSGADGIRFLGMKGTITKTASEYLVEVTEKTTEEEIGKGTKVVVTDTSEGLENAFYKLNPKTGISLDSIKSLGENKIWFKYSLKDDAFTTSQLPSSK